MPSKEVKSNIICLKRRKNERERKGKKRKEEERGKRKKEKPKCRGHQATFSSSFFVNEVSHHHLRSFHFLQSKAIFLELNAAFLFPFPFQPPFELIAQRSYPGEKNFIKKFERTIQLNYTPTKSSGCDIL